MCELQAEKMIDDRSKKKAKKKECTGYPEFAADLSSNY